MSLNNSGFQRVNVVLPEPFAPAIKVNLKMNNLASGSAFRGLSSLDFARDIGSVRTGVTWERRVGQPRASCASE